MKTILLISSILLVISGSTSWAQDNAQNWTVPITALTADSPASINLIWTENDAAGTDYVIYRKIAGASGWGGAIGNVATGDSIFVDNNVTVGTNYEYLIQKVTGNTLYSWGYISASIKKELEFEKGDFLLVVDSTHVLGLSQEISDLEEDLFSDGWRVTTIIANPNDAPTVVKGQITAEYNSLPDLKAVFLLGHVPVPYSGNLYPDAHTNHEGAWPADVYYADIDGNWTDVSVNNTVASDVRNDNVPGDGKFDQSKPPSTLELQICRVDFNDLPVYTESEEELLRNYLNRAHEFKTAAYVPQEKAVYDQGSFTGMQEGFAQNGIRNFAPFVGYDNIEEADYFTSLTTESYLWSYGCGSGSYTSAGALDNGTSLTSAELAGTDMEATFTMLFGSYFGDWDKTNNLLRAALANGRTLSVSWAGRPNWHYHRMAMGDNLGTAAMASMDLNTDYLSLNLGVGFVTGEGVHVAQLGDPSLRAYYLAPPTNLVVANNNNVADLSWTASTDGSIEGYNIYRRVGDAPWIKVNTAINVGTTYSDNTIPTGDLYEYMVTAVKLKTNSSGSFYNESLGIHDATQFSVGVEDIAKVSMKLYPNPTQDKLTLQSSEIINDISIYAANGQQVYSATTALLLEELDVSNFNSGAYVVVINSASGRSELTFVKN